MSVLDIKLTLTLDVELTLNFGHPTIKIEMYLKSKPNVSPLLKLVGGSIETSDL